MAAATQTPPSARRRRASPPITRHPLFPAIVALWFAALVGVGSFALRTSLIEALILALRVDTIVPAAAPPLGTTARLLVALAFGSAGAVVGWMLARRIAAKPAAAPQVLKVADLDEPAMPVAEEMAPALDPAGLADEPEEEASLLSVEPVIEPEAGPPALTAAQRIASADLADLSHVELMERLAIALQQREQRRGNARAEHASPVVQFPDFVDRRNARLPAAPALPAPQETERALRHALAQLQRMSGGA